MTASVHVGGDPRTPAAGVRRTLLWGLRLCLGGLFVYTGVVKLADPTAFAVEIHNYQLFPALAPILAGSLPAIELAVGGALVLGPRPWLRAGALSCVALMVVFTAAVTSAVARGINISCGCFGAGSSPVTLVTVARDVILLAASVGLLLLAGSPVTMGNPKRVPQTPPSHGARSLDPSPR
jgi:uncharacterized membrane protein YphA (DoxX/SURF4 family)